MTKLLIALCLMGFSIHCAWASQPLTETEKLASTAKIWGFLKYHHPHVTKGKMDWNDQLVQILPEVKAAEDSKSLSEVYLNWIEQLGEVKPCRSCKKEDEKVRFEKNFDRSWMQSETFTPQLTAKLKYIQENRSQGKNAYVKTSLFGMLVIKDDPVTEGMEYPSADYRLSCLFQYWNVVEYFYPYKYLTDQDWDDVLVEMIPKFKNAQDTVSYHLAMLELTAKIDDSHAYFYSEQALDFFGHKRLPVRFKIIDSKAVIIGFYNDSLAALNDLKVGDIITEVDGKSVESMVEELWPYLPSSNSAVKLRSCRSALFRGNKDSVNLTIEREGIAAQKTVGRYRFSDFNYQRVPMAPPWKIIDDSIGYVHMGYLTRKQVKDMMGELKNTSTIIFDVRNYPLGTVYDIMDELLPEKREFVKFTFPDVSYPGKFKMNDPMNCGKKNKDPYQGKVIVLLNELTQSHAEFTCMAFQTLDRVTLIGSQTSGADGNVVGFQFLGGFATMITGLGTYYPDGGETQRVGIVPDVVVEATIDGIQQGKDEVLDKALSLAKGG